MSKRSSKCCWISISRWMTSCASRRVMSRWKLCWVWGLLGYYYMLTQGLWVEGIDLLYSCCGRGCKFVVWWFGRCGPSLVRVLVLSFWERACFRRIACWSCLDVWVWKIVGLKFCLAWFVLQVRTFFTIWDERVEQGLKKQCLEIWHGKGNNVNWGSG